MESGLSFSVTTAPYIPNRSWPSLTTNVDDIDQKEISVPYITNDAREALSRSLYDGGTPESAGELNFLISYLLDKYVTHHGLSYATINTLVGVLECAKLELYRRVAVPYEDTKIIQNGDVYSSEALGDFDG